MPDDRVNDIIRIALETDCAYDDLTSGMVVDGKLECSAFIVARQEGIISGQDYAEETFGYLDDSLEYSRLAKDGGRVGPGDMVSRIRGRAVSVMAAERTALNFLGHLSGIATLTASFVRKLRGSGITVLDTRKTTPGLRAAEKKAVRDGGGSNHRMNLADYILVKENHIKAAGGLAGVVRRLGGRLADAEIEVDSLEMLRELLDNPPGRIMLDNFTPEMAAEAVSEIEKSGGRRPEIEISGGITLDSIEEYTVPGVDFISVGLLTTSAPALDLSLILDQLNGGAVDN
ncbi:MAG: carboxylating nicotinate-nucleotide diphosphorylase [Candidatus Krumholzibacteriales bacterium]